MPVYLKIDNCNVCPFQKHKGGFGKISYIPYCKMDSPKYRELPYMVGASDSGIVVASATGNIPEWCSLRKGEKE